MKHRRVQGAEIASVDPPNDAPAISAPPFIVHRWKLEGYATVNNAADTRYFSKHTALVFQFLDVLDILADDVRLLKSCKLQCGVCGRGNWRWIKGGKGKGSTSNMVVHMKEKHSQIWNAAQRLDESAWGTLPSSDLSSSSPGALPLAPAPTFNIEEFYKRLTRWIVTGNQPFAEIENEEFRDMLTYLRPAIEDHLVHSTAIKSRILSHAGVSRQLTKHYLSNLTGLMAIACDAWTSSNRIALLAITASWITTDWRLEETLLDFVELQGAHTGENMADAVSATVAELGIADKVVALVSDNAGNNGTLVKHLSTRFRKRSPRSRWDGDKGRIRCLAHIIQLAVMSLLRGLRAVPEPTDIRDFDYSDFTLTEEDAEAMVSNVELESLESDDDGDVNPLVDEKSGISKLRKIARIVRSSPQRMELFRMTVERIEDRNAQLARAANQEHTKKRVKNLILDVVTRWNSLFYMLERALEFREAIDALTVHPKVNIYRPYSLSPEDWTAVSLACTWLKFFRKASARIAGKKYPTLSFSLRIYFFLIAYVTRLQKDPSVTSSSAAVKGMRLCREKLLEFFDKSTYDLEYYYFAMILDPRYKDTLFKVNSSILRELFSKGWISDCATTLIETCKEYYNQDLHCLAIQTQPPQVQIPNNDDFDSVFEASVPRRSPQYLGSASLKKDISDYLPEEEIGEISPLTWWRNHAARFPRLAAMARDFLCIPGSSVAVERVLSTGRDIIFLRRASLSADTIRVLMNYRADIMLEKGSKRGLL